MLGETVTARQRFRSVSDYVIIYVLFYRKEITSTVLILSMLGTIGFLGTQNIVTQIVTTIVVPVLSTDYRLLKLVSRQLYDWIQGPSSQFWPDEPIETALELIRVNYHAKRYENAGNPKMEIIEANGGELIVNSSGKQELLTEGMLFQVYHEDTISHQGQELRVPRRLGLARVTNIHDSVTWLRVTEWSQDYPTQERALRGGRLDYLNAYIQAKMSQEVQNSDESELEEAYKSVQLIHHNRERITS